MEACPVHIDHLTIEYGVCKQDPCFENLENLQQRSNTEEILRGFYC